MSDRQSVCLTMIVRNEAHIVTELLDLVAPLIDYWVVVDTGSDDGTQDLIRDVMARHGIPGELHERTWRDFGHNRSEALALAQGKSDYIWMMDADDTVIGTPEFRNLTADVYYMLIRDGGINYWRRQLFRDGVPWFYKGVLHEFPHCDEPVTEDRLYGDYYIHSRRLGARNKDPEKYAKDAEVLLAHVTENPDDDRSVFYLAQSYHNHGDFENGRIWYAKRAAMGGWEEEVYYSMLRVGECLSALGAPWAEVENAYLRAWEFRPQRAEALHALAFRLRTQERYHLGYMFARQAAEIPLPEEDRLFVDTDVHAWRALDEQAVCASWIGKATETFDLCRRLLAVPGVDEADRARFTVNRDLGVPQLLEENSEYPEHLAHRPAGPRNADVTVSFVAGPVRAQLEQSLNSFLRCCSDVDQVGRFLVLDAGLTTSDRVALSGRYPFLEFVIGTPGMRFPDQIDRLRGEIGGRYWVQVGQGCRFFARDPLITRLRSVLQAEPGVFQVGINVGDSPSLTGTAAPAEVTRSAPGTGRYVLTDKVSYGPQMVDTARFEQAIAAANAGGSAGLGSATLDEVLCVKD